MNSGMKRLDRLSLWIGPALFLVSMAVYALTLTRGPFPGDSARLAAQQLGLDPFGSALYPLWSTAIRVFAWINPAGSHIISMNLFSALCSALAVWLMYEVVSRLPHLHVPLQKEAPPSRTPGRIAGVAAALMLAFCIPFWMTATQTHHLPFEIALLLGATLLFLHYVNTHNVRMLYAFCALYGVGMVESVLFSVSAPIFAAYLVVLLALRDQLKFGFVVKLIPIYLAGLLVYFYAAWRFYRLPAFEWLEYSHFLQIIWFMWRDQYVLIMHGLGQLGWLIVFMTAILPCLIILAMPQLLTSRHAVKPGPIVLHVVLTVLAGLLLFNAQMSPWELTGRTQLIVFPYLLWAVYGGYTVGYWFVILSGRFSTRSRLPVMRTLRPVWLIVVGVAIVYAGHENKKEVSPRGVDIVQSFISEALDTLGERNWIISNGIFDHSLMLMAAERNQPLHVLNPRLARNPAYLRYLTTLFDDPRLQSLASIGLVPLLNEWVAEGEDILSQLAVLSWDEAWSSHGFYPVPERVLFGGVRDLGKTDVDRLYEQNLESWAKWRDRLQEGGETTQLVNELIVWIGHHVSRLANNFGVMLEEVDEPQRAFEAYRVARELNADNISALLNMGLLAHRKGYEEEDRLKKEVEALANLPEHELRHWTLTARYGTVRHPESYAQRGMVWAMSGKADIAIADIQRAIQAGADGEGLSFLLASLYFDDQQFEESERLYSRILRETPDHPNALLGLAQIATRRGHFDLARGYLDRLKELRVMPTRVRLEEGIIEVLSGREGEGRRILESLVKDQPGVTTAWAVLVMIALSQEDEALLNRSLQTLGELGAMDIRSLMIIAHAQMSRNQFSEARNTLERAERVRPDYVPIHEQLLRLDVAEMNQDAARRRVETILSLDSRNALANYVLGSLHYAAGNLMLAESAFRSSIRTTPIPEALNDLAWLLHLRGEYDEAYTHVRHSLELNPVSPFAWSTYGNILMQRGEHDEAYGAFQQALERRPGDPRFQLGLALLHERTGRREESLALVDEVLERVTWLTDDERKQAMELSTRLRRDLSPAS